MSTENKAQFADGDSPCVLEWGAVSLPFGDPSRVTNLQLFPTLWAAIAEGSLCGFDWRVYPMADVVNRAAIPAPEGAPALTDVQLDAAMPTPEQFGPLMAPWDDRDRKILRTAMRAGAALAAPAPQATDAELERRTGEPHVDGWPLVSGLPLPAAPQTKEPTNDR